MNEPTHSRRLAALAVVIVVAAAACSAPAATSNIAVKDAWARPTAAKLAMGDATATPMPKTGEAMTKTEGMGGTQMAMEGPVSAAYMIIENKGGQADKLVAVETSVAAVNEIHETKEMADGKMGMQPVQGGLEVPAKGSVELKPGGLHIMLMNLRQDLTPGQTFTLTLKFQSGKQMTIDVPVKAPQ